MSLIWVDTETNGLESWTVLLEVAVVVTDNDLNILDEGSWVLKPPMSNVAELMDISTGVVKEMHTKNGLWMDVHKSATTYPEAERSIIELIYSSGVDPQTAPMAGSTIGFDRNIITKYLPTVNEYCHYRSVDVSSIKELCKVWNPEIYSNRPNKEEANKTHRALDDIKASIQELEYYRDNFLICYQGHVK